MVGRHFNKTRVSACGCVCLRVFGRSFADDVVVVKCRLESEAKDDISVGTVYSRWLCMVAALVQFYSKKYAKWVLCCVVVWRVG